MPIDVEAYYQRYGPMVLRRCRGLLRDEELAVDAMHDVFVEILRRQDQLEDVAPSSMLYRIATNVCLNRIRTQRRHPEDRDDELLHRIAAADEGEARGWAKTLVAQIFRRELASTRTIAVMHYVDGLTLAEVAQQADMSVSGVRKRLRTLRANVADLLDDAE